MIKQIIFDFDGTIVNSADLVLDIINQLAQKYHCSTIDEARLGTLRGIPITERLRRVGLPLYKLPKCLVDISGAYQKSAHTLKIFDGMKNVTEALIAGGIGVSIISSNSLQSIREVLKCNEFEVFGDIVSCGNLFGKHKVIEKYIKKHKLSAREVIYVGDELRDIEACKKINVRIISVAWGYDTPELLGSAKPDFLAHAPEEILDIIAAQNTSK